ncbi:Tyrosine-protein phosphatase YwqE [BD1-7 clade bacterium]|uniref:protein-tyrosine-phosphatase n=1 Tax=BD1-7 clade bacterium TaxID=2029982 RepID=A0A5S9MRU8_9GAMM|nr:Tyrosine-protein phosphatase YwqE [BD1-7 clade bacterium]
MLDIHNHYLAGVDDGPAELSGSLALVDLAIDQGIQKVVCTPHYHHGRYDWDAGKVTSAFDALVSAVAGRLDLALAAEVRFSDEVLIDLRKGRVPFIGRWGEMDALLLEMPHQNVPMGIEAFLKWLKKEGIQPIIAHPERNKEVMKSPRRARDLYRAGAVFQLTAGSIAGHFGENALSTAKILLREEGVRFVASDAHNLKRPPAMKAAADALATMHDAGDVDVSASRINELMVLNPGVLTAGLFA